MIPQQDARETIDGPEWRTQVVRNRVAERLKLLDGRFELGRAFGDTLLKINVQSANLLFGPPSLDDLCLQHFVDRGQCFGQVELMDRYSKLAGDLGSNLLVFGGEKARCIRG